MHALPFYAPPINCVNTLYAAYIHTVHGFIGVPIDLFMKYLN